MRLFVLSNAAQRKKKYLIEFYTTYKNETEYLFGNMILRILHRKQFLCT